LGGLGTSEVHLGRSSKFSNDQQQDLSNSIRALRSGNISPQKFKNKLKENKVPMTNKLNILIRRIDAGDSKVTYHEFGSEIFKNYKDSSDATHFSRGEKLEPFNLMKRAKSPEVRVNTRF